MLKKENRLRTRFEYKITKKYGKKYSSHLFNIYYLQPNNYTGLPKIGIVTSKFVHKNAVKRNRVSRIFREIVRLNINKIPSDFWVAIYPKKLVLEKNYEEISTELNKALSKIFVA